MTTATGTLFSSLCLLDFIEQSLNMRLMSLSTTNKYFTFTDCSKVLFCKTKSENVNKMRKKKDKNMKLNTITRFRRKFNEALFDFKHFWLLLRDGQVNENRSESSRLNDKSPHEFNVTATFFPAFFFLITKRTCFYFCFHRCHHHLEVVGLSDEIQVYIMLHNGMK